MNEPLLQRINSYITTNCLLTPNSKIVVGLSGGPDSVFLLHYLADLQKSGAITSLVAAHLDHEWRAESHKDAEFCHELARSLGINLISRKLSELNLSLKFNGSHEEIGRKARRTFFQKLLQETGSNHIALAHHLQDQQETFFIRLLRGATLTGLTAMQAKDDVYIRPLLQTSKPDILAYLDAHNILYLTDPTNTSDAFLRNRIRMSVLPTLQNCDNRFDKNFMATLQRLQDTESFLDELTTTTFQDLAEQNNGSWHINVTKLLTLHPIMRYRALLHWLCHEKVPFGPTQNFFDELLRFLDGNDSKTHRAHHAWSLIKKKQTAWIVKI
ncbi:MAG: tRNA lysidine(34) synthetase TilS [Candidatus Dependentiae bacterium]|nr:tRNA lysidine(34) synthetase TilS [Candidatus Dependentiae bacterium]